MNNPQPTILRKRGRHTPVPPSGYLRYVEAARLFEPLDVSSFAYRARIGDIESIDDGGIKAYNVESIKRVRDAIILEQASKSKEAPQPQKETGSTLEERFDALEKEVKNLRKRVKILEAQITE